MTTRPGRRRYPIPSPGPASAAQKARRHLQTCAPVQPHRPGPWWMSRPIKANVVREHQFHRCEGKTAAAPYFGTKVEEAGIASGLAGVYV
ncbi:hypothetical protein MY11210_009136 [Beauveria gryllotalpidicola]